ncbi:hypothetical protein [Paracoccus lutimaris]|uniref:Uncharacterized protein n=1 Tax=Paracoccus lutimaris TaxID=1490030 RepID=A0A368YTA0_9RHOB|nr:hypothetical protein [Paracoccus lutimaris]RCW83440.1 hypothetical protein DFP89_110122 [Paracoccus lutimaris]
MSLRLIGGALTLIALTACGDRTHDYPALLPTAQILADPAIPAHAGDAARDDSLGASLDARGKALAGRAGGPPMASNADLQSRADALRARAAILSQQSLDDPDCPADQPDCAGQSAQD